MHHRGFIVYLISLIIFLLLVSKTALSEEMHSFHLGTHEIQGTKLEFSFPDENVTFLYLFNIHPGWEPQLEGKVKAVAKLYNGKKQLLDTGTSVCINTKIFRQFGSIAFNKINRSNVKKVKYFSIKPVNCE